MQGSCIQHSSIYRHDRLQFLKDSYEAALQRDFILGVKVVRGAYMEKERKRAEQMNYPSPIQPDKKATDRDFNEAIQFCIDHIDRIAWWLHLTTNTVILLTTQLLHTKKFTRSIILMSIFPNCMV